jgi:hypothetical protein
MQGFYVSKVHATHPRALPISGCVSSRDGPRAPIADTGGRRSKRQSS